MPTVFGLPSFGVSPPPREASAEGADSAAPVPDACAHSGLGLLQGQQLSVPADSQPPEPGSVDSLPQAVQPVALKVQLQPAAQPQAASLVAQAPSVSDLAPLYVPVPGTLATNRVVIDALQAHAQAANTELSREAIQGYVALGERAVRAIVPPLHAGRASDLSSGSASASAAPAPRLHVMDVALTPNLEVLRGISWYVVACAAQQDANQRATGSPRMIEGQELTDLSISGSYLFMDPNHAIYNFLNASPLVYPRISTHFNELTVGALDALGYADQRGIEDYGRGLAGENGTLLFDKLNNEKGPVMFLKFEHAGVPPIVSSAQMVDDRGQGSATAYSAAERVLMHTLSFIRTRFAVVPGVERKEHVYKGLLKNDVHNPFLKIVAAAEKFGLLEGGVNAVQHAKNSQNRGLPHLDAALAQIGKSIDAQPERAEELLQLRQELDALQASIQDAKDLLGAQSDHLQITRRGAETHVDLAPIQAHLIQARERFTVLQGDAAHAPGQLQPYTLEGRAGSYTIPAGVSAAAALDWELHGMEINGAAYPALHARGSMAPAASGATPTLEQGCRAFVAACGDNPVAAEWISRFALQCADALVQYLSMESLGVISAKTDLLRNQVLLSIRSLLDGALEMTLEIRLENHQEALWSLKDPGSNMVLELSPGAKLNAGVTLRFDRLDTFSRGQMPLPAISKPLGYTTSDLDLFRLVDAEFNSEIL